MSKPYSYGGKNYALFPLVIGDTGSPCNGCAFDSDLYGCLNAPECGMESVFVEAVEVSEEDDFLSGVQACDRFDPTCESCQ